MTTARPLTLVLTILLTQAACADEDQGPEASATLSRDKILPLVSEPGKEKKIFTSFETGENAVWNEDFWGAALGFEAYTGMGWHNPQVGILVTPEHIVGAAHYGVPTKGIDLYGLDGSFLGNRKPARREDGKYALVRLDPDIMVIRLQGPAPEGAAVAKLPDPDGHKQRLAWANLPEDKRPLLVATDWRNPKPTPPAKEGEPKKRKQWRITRTAHPVVLRSFHEGMKSMQWNYGPAAGNGIDPSYHETINQGDSSNPIFWVSKEGLVLASTFSGVNSGPNYGHPEIQKALQEAIDSLGGTKPHRLQFAPVP